MHICMISIHEFIYYIYSICKEKEREQPTNYNKEYSKSTHHSNKGLTKQEWDAP